MTPRFLFLLWPCTALLSGICQADSVPPGQSALIGTLDLSDTFTLGAGTRTDLAAGAYPIGATFPDALQVESASSFLPLPWSDALWSITDDVNVNNGTPPYPGSSGGGSATGMTQTGNPVVFGLEYDFRSDFVVQFDAVQSLDRVDLTTGNSRNLVAGGTNPNAFSIFIRADGQTALPEVGLSNDLLGEVDTGLDSGLAGVQTGQWHNYAVRFNLPAKTLTVFVDEILLGTVDLTTLGSDTVAAGAFADLLTEESNDAVSVGASGGTRVWTDNFQIGSPGPPAEPGIRLGSLTVIRDKKNTLLHTDDTYTIRGRVMGRGPVGNMGWNATAPAGITGPVSGNYGDMVVFADIPIAVAEVVLNFSDAVTAAINTSITVTAPALPVIPAYGVAVGSSDLIAESDYADSFTFGDGDSGIRQGTAYTAGANPIESGSPLLLVESLFNNPALSWSPGLWSLNNNAVIVDGVPAWPGDSGAGSVSGITQTGGPVDYGIEYGKRRDFVVQFDAVQTPDRINLTMGNVRDSIAGPTNPNGLSVFIREDGHPGLPEVGIYNAGVGEVDAGMDTGLAGVTAGEWHNYAARFDLVRQTLTVYVDEITLGTLDLTTFHGGAFADQLSEESNHAVSVGGSGGNRVWTDNFQLGAPPGIPVGGSSLIATPDYSDTFTIGAGANDNIRGGVFHTIGSFPILDEAHLMIENTYGNPPVSWSTGLWSLNNDTIIAPGNLVWPGGIGGGSATGITQTGNAVDYGIEYGKREDFVVQFDAVQTTDRINITAGNVRDAAAELVNPNGISVFFRINGHATLPEVGIYNVALGEISADLDTGLADVDLGEWHNYGVRFNFPARQLEIYVDEIKLGTVDLATLGGPTAQNEGTIEPGAFPALISEFSNDAVSVGGSGGDRIWTDNFQMGLPAGAVSQVDTDGDGMSDADELTAGTDPGNPASLLRFTAFQPTTTGPSGYEGRFPTVAGRFYRIYSSTDLALWTRENLSGTLAGNNAEAVVTLTPPPGTPRVYYRIHVAATDNFPASAN